MSPVRVFTFILDYVWTKMLPAYFRMIFANLPYLLLIKVKKKLPNSIINFESLAVNRLSIFIQALQWFYLNNIIVNNRGA